MTDMRSTTMGRTGLRTSELRLGDDDLALLDEVSAVELGFPHDFVGSDAVRDVIHGTRHRLIGR